MEKLFDVWEVVIATGERKRMAKNLPEHEADAVIRMAIARRGVEGSFYRPEPASD